MFENGHNRSGFISYLIGQIHAGLPTVETQIQKVLNFCVSVKSHLAKKNQLCTNKIFSIRGGGGVRKSGLFLMIDESVCDDNVSGVISFPPFPIVLFISVYKGE